MTFVLMLAAVAGVALGLFNGANDNGKPVATLIGSGVLSLRRGLFWGNVATLLGALAAVLWGAALLKAFSGKGLLDGVATGQAVFLPAVGLGAAATVALATRLSLPVSTTHALLGGLVGAGWALGGRVAWGVLGVKLAGPLVLSPVAAMGLTLLIVYPLRAFSQARAASRCVCASVPALAIQADGSAALTGRIEVQAGELPACRPEGGWVLMPPRASLMKGLHVLSAMAVAFARGLNDTPKLAAMLLPLAFLGSRATVGLSAVAMGIGGWVLSRGVARTMSHRITQLEGREGDALAGNLATAFLVLLASRWGLPVSTTHVATGALVGAGASRGEFNGRTLGTILLAWITTLPLAALLAGLAAMGLKHG